MISREALEKFKEIWRSECGEELTDEKAMEEAINLLTMFNAIYRPVQKEWLEELKHK